MCDGGRKEAEILLMIQAALGDDLRKRHVGLRRRRWLWRWRRWKWEEARNGEEPDGDEIRGGQQKWRRYRNILRRRCRHQSSFNFRQSGGLLQSTSENPLKGKKACYVAEDELRVSLAKQVPDIVYKDLASFPFTGTSGRLSRCSSLIIVECSSG